MAKVRDKVTEVWGKLSHEGILDSEILGFVLSRMDEIEAWDALKDYADICGIEVRPESDDLDEDDFNEEDLLDGDLEDQFARLMKEGDDDDQSNDL